MCIQYYSSAMEEQQQQKIKTQSQLPKDIIENEILIHLPPECLARFRCVCKSWQSLFSDHEFVKAHLSRQHYSNDQNYVVSCRSSYELSIVSSFKVTIIDPIPFIANTNLVGSINGLICFTGVKGFTLWNPVIRQYKEVSTISQLLVHANSCEEVKALAERGVHERCSYLYGFGWDPTEDDYKVVMVYTCISESKDASVYSFKSNSWTQLVLTPRIIKGSSVTENLYSNPAPTTIVRECPYWCCSKYLKEFGEPDYKHRYTAVFKFVAEENEFRSLPNFESSSDDVPLRHFTLVNLKDCLAGMAYKSYLQEDSALDIYSLDHEGSSGLWNKIYTVRANDCTSLLSWVPAKGKWRYKKLEQVICYDSETNEIKDVVHNLPLGIWLRSYSGLGCFSYTPSLELGCFSYTPSLELGCFSYTPSLEFVQEMKSIMHSENKY